MITFAKIVRLTPLIMFSLANVVFSQNANIPPGKKIKWCLEPAADQGLVNAFRKFYFNDRNNGVTPGFSWQQQMARFRQQIKPIDGIKEAKQRGETKISVYIGLHSSIILKAFGRPETAKATSLNGVGGLSSYEWTYTGMDLTLYQPKLGDPWKSDKVSFTIQDGYVSYIGGYDDHPTFGWKNKPFKAEKGGKFPIDKKAALRDLDGKSKEQIIQLIGKPTDSNIFGGSEIWTFRTGFGDKKTQTFTQYKDDKGRNVGIVYDPVLDKHYHTLSMQFPEGKTLSTFISVR